MRLIFLFLLLFVLFVPVFAQNNLQVTAANGQMYAVAGKDRQRNNEEIVVYSAEFYEKKPTNQSGIDVLIVDNKIAAIQDRAGAVYVQNKPDPGAIKTDKKGIVLSAHGAARKWVLANLKIGDAVIVGEQAKPTLNASSEVAPAASIPCFQGAYYRKAVSSFDVWTGIVGVVKLGTPKIDEARLNATTKQRFDNFSVYMGGRSGNQGSNAGLAWEFTVD